MIFFCTDFLSLSLQSVIFHVPLHLTFANDFIINYLQDNRPRLKRATLFQLNYVKCHIGLSFGKLFLQKIFISRILFDFTEVVCINCSSFFNAITPYDN